MADDAEEAPEAKPSLSSLFQNSPLLTSPHAAPSGAQPRPDIGAAGAPPAPAATEATRLLGAPQPDNLSTVTSIGSAEARTFLESALLRRDVWVGPKARRKCTDISFLVLFVLFWLGMGAVGYAALERDAHKRLTRGTDFEGESCGDDAPFVYFPDPEAPVALCVAECPAAAGAELSRKVWTLSADGTKGEEQRLHWATYATEAQSFYCFPADGSPVASAVGLAAAYDALGRFMGAISQSWPVVLSCSGVALAVAVFYLMLLRLLGGCMVALSIAAVQTILVLAAVDLRNDSLVEAYSDYRSELEVASTVMFVLAAVFFLLVNFLFRRIVLAVTFLRQATTFIFDVKGVLLLPFLKFGLLLALLGWWLPVTVLLFAAGAEEARVVELRHGAELQHSAEVEAELFEPDPQMRLLFIYHLAGLLWTAAFILCFVRLAVATAVAVWYFTSEVNGRRDMTYEHPMRTALGAAGWYHLGTLAFGSLVVSISQPLKRVFRYVEDKTHGLEDVFFVRCVLLACKCCLLCLEHLLRFVSHQAFLVTAINGNAFCPAAKMAFELVRLNLVRVGTMQLIGSAAVFFGRLFVSTAALGTCWYVLRVGHWEEQLQSQLFLLLVPLLLVALTSYLIGTGFMAVYSEAINCLLMCFVVDEHQHSGRALYTRPSHPLRNAVEAHLRPKWETSL